MRHSIDPIAESEYDENRPALYEHTSGTTGEPKIVSLSNLAFSAIVYGYNNFEFIFNPGDKVLNIIPMFLAYGIFTSIHHPLCGGAEVILIPQIEEKKFFEQLLYYKPQDVNSTKTHWTYVQNTIEKLEISLETLKNHRTELQKNKTLSISNLVKLKRIDKKIKKISATLNASHFDYLINWGIGGDGESAEFEKQINEFVKSHGGKYLHTKGYGMTEVGSAFTVGSGLNNFGYGTVGIPLAKNNIMIVDDEEFEVGYEEVGEIYLTGPSIMTEYVNNRAATNDTKKFVHSQYWIKSGDLGFIDSKGALTIVGRKKRLIITEGGNKVFPIIIENKISELPEVSDVCVVGIPDVVHGNILKAHITLKAEFSSTEEAIMDKIKKWCNQELQSNYVPDEFQIDTDFPLTSNSKVDVEALLRKDLVTG